MELVSRNVVVTTNKFNPSILTQPWLIRSGVVEEGDLELPCVFTDAAAQIRTRLFLLVAVPEFIQLVPKPDLEEGQDRLAIAKVNRIVSALPHTPYTGIGVNFAWHEKPEPDMPTLSRRLFFRNDSPAFAFFDVPGAHFGAYMSRDFDGLRLKLDVKPVMQVMPHPGEESKNEAEQRLQFGFNFHKDLSGENVVGDVESVLARWDSLKSESQRITARALGD